MLRPQSQFLPVPTLHHLIVSDSVVGRRYGHGRIICFAHDVLSECVEAVVDMLVGDGKFLAFFAGVVRASDDFLVLLLLIKRNVIRLRHVYSSSQYDLTDNGDRGKL